MLEDVCQSYAVQKPEQMNPWNPDEASEQQAQAASDGSPDLTFPDQNGKGKRVGEKFYPI